MGRQLIHPLFIRRLTFLYVEPENEFDMAANPGSTSLLKEVTNRPTLKAWQKEVYLIPRISNVIMRV